MEYAAIKTIDDAREWLNAQSEVSSERLHTLIKQFFDHADELIALVEQRGIKRVGAPAM